MIIGKKRKFVTCYNHGTEAFDLRYLRQIPMELSHIEVHRKEDGAVDDKPSYLFVMRDVHGRLYMAQMTEATLFDAIEHTMP